MPARRATPAPAAPRTDGRRAWRDRNLNAVVDALLDLFAEGNLRPGAGAIAARSGVSRRSVFRYFDDLDELDRVAIERQEARVAHLLDVPRAGEGTLPARIDALVTQRLRLYGAIAPVARVSRLRAPFEPVLAAELRRTRAFLRRQVERQFAPEFASMPPPQRAATLAAADALCAFESYDLLASPPAAGPKAAGAAMRAGLGALFRSGRARRGRTPA